MRNAIKKTSRLHDFNFMFKFSKEIKSEKCHLYIYLFLLLIIRLVEASENQNPASRQVSLIKNYSTQKSNSSSFEYLFNFRGNKYYFLRSFLSVV